MANTTMANTTSVEFLGPSNLNGYDRRRLPSLQLATIPKTFLDAMEVREQVFVREQGVSLENEFDPDDHRACHWVAYESLPAAAATSSSSSSSSAEEAAATTTTSSSSRRPIGTIRLVPFPHPPHPEPGSVFTMDDLSPPPVLDAAASDSNTAAAVAPPSTPPYIIDRATTYHDGREAYIKLGRMAVLKEFRGRGVAKVLVTAAMDWMKHNPGYFNCDREGESGEWKGLLCVHAQQQVQRAWANWGFVVDEGMGAWVEEGIGHVGMFQRLDVDIV